MNRRTSRKFSKTYKYKGRGPAWLESIKGKMSGLNPFKSNCPQQDPSQMPQMAQQDPSQMAQQDPSQMAQQDPSQMSQMQPPPPSSTDLNPQDYMSGGYRRRTRRTRRRNQRRNTRR